MTFENKYDISNLEVTLEMQDLPSGSLKERQAAAPDSRSLGQFYRNSQGICCYPLMFAETEMMVFSLPV